MATVCEPMASGCPAGIPYLDTVRCCDCLEGIREIPDSCIDLIVTDPPYLFAATQGGGAFGSANRAYHGELEPISHGYLREVNEQMLRVMKMPNIYIWCSKDQLRDTMDWWLDNADVSMDLLTWHKTNPTPLCSNKYLSDTEYLLFFRGKGVRVYGEYATKRKWYATPTNKADKDEFGHPTVKPLEITRNLVINSSPGGGIVLDPFAGTGTTAVASKELGRRYIGFEKVPAYAETANRRLDETPAMRPDAIGRDESRSRAMPMRKPFQAPTDGHDDRKGGLK